MQLIQIVPRLPPEIDGIGDYALNLACQLRDDFGLDTHFVVGNPYWQGSSEIENFPVSQITSMSAGNLICQLGENTGIVLLHYVGYGYAKRGYPTWLVDGLRRWRNQKLKPHHQLITMFHEIAAGKGKPWTSSFWLSTWQTRLATRLVKISDRIITSKQEYATILQHFSAGKHSQVPHVPVFSTLGEPKEILPLSKRQRRLVIFGGRANRLRVYQSSLADLLYICRILTIEELWDLGTATGLALSEIIDLPVVETGRLEANQLSHIFANSWAGLCNYNPDYLAKSTIFAAYCAHGLLPINIRGTNQVVDGIEAGKHYWVAQPHTQIVPTTAQLQGIAFAAHAWYHHHDLSSQARVFAQLMSK